MEGGGIRESLEGRAYLDPGITCTGTCNGTRSSVHWGTQRNTCRIEVTTVEKDGRSYNRIVRVEKQAGTTLTGSGLGSAAEEVRF